MFNCLLIMRSSHILCLDRSRQEADKGAGRVEKGKVLAIAATYLKKSKKKPSLDPPQEDSLASHHLKSRHKETHCRLGGHA